jgi:hypothetical protein
MRHRKPGNGLVDGQAGDQMNAGFGFIALDVSEKIFAGAPQVGVY